MAKVVLITGITSGFGKATATLLNARGYIVYGLIRRQVEGLDKKINLVKADVTDNISVQKAVSEIILKEGRIDVLINNAGLGIGGSIEDSSPGDIQLQMMTNFMGYVNMIQAVLPAMRNQGGGTIVNISSIGGLMGLPYQGFYSASKFAIEGMSESLRMELAPYHIKVIVIQPGDFSTNFTSNRKQVITTGADSAYKIQSRRTLSIIEKDEKNGLSPDYLARKIAKILERNKPCHHYIIAKPDQKFAVLLKHLLPDKWFSMILSSHYGVKS